MNTVQNPDSDHNRPEQPLSVESSSSEALAKAKHAQRFSRGVKWIGAGALTLLFSFGINFLLFQSSDDFCTVMYVMTSAGALCCLKGMTDIF